MVIFIVIDAAIYSAICIEGKNYACFSYFT